MVNEAMRVLSAAAMVLALGLLDRPASACSVCGCGDPLVHADDANPTRGRIRLALDVEYLTAQARSDDDPSQTETLAQQTLRPVVVYSPTDMLNLVASLPLVRKQWALQGGADGASATPIGLGDMEAGARLFLFNRVNWSHLRRQDLGLSLGTSLPTGLDDVRVSGERIDQHAQLGTGALGPYAGAFYAVHQDPWNASATLSARTHTTNRFGYRFGNAILWSSEGTLRPWERFALVAGTDGRYAARDTSGGDRQENTGGLVIDAVAGASLQLYGELWLHAKAQLPVVTRLFGEQHVGPTLLASVQYTFD